MSSGGETAPRVSARFLEAYTALPTPFHLLTMTCIATLLASALITPFAPMLAPLSSAYVFTNCAEPVCQQLNR